MSEFREATAAVAALEEQVAVLRAAGSSITDISDLQAVTQSQYALEFVQAALVGDVDAMMAKFRQRCVMVDPVTQQPRFGPKMLAKVQDMLSRYDAIKQEVEDAGLASETAARIDQFQTSKRTQEATAAAIAEEERKAAEHARALQQKKQLEEEAERKRREAEEETQRVAALAAAAQHKRAEREQQRLEEERKQQEEERLRQERNASVGVGKEALERSIELLRIGAGDQRTFTGALGKLATVLSNICASPENAAFRHIPKDNANFHTDIGQFDGGHQCLLAIGFSEVVQDDKFVFVLEEPDLSDDLDKWSEWFDNLKVLHELVVNKLATK